MSKLDENVERKYEGLLSSNEQTYLLESVKRGKNIMNRFYERLINLGKPGKNKSGGGLLPNENLAVKNLCNNLQKEEPQKDPTTVFEIALDEKTKLKFYEIGVFDPPRSSIKVKVTGPMGTYLQHNLTANRSIAKNLDNTDLNELKTWVIDYCNINCPLLETLGIQDIKKLTPKQAILLAQGIVTQALDYDYAMAANKNISRSSPTAVGYQLANLNDMGRFTTLDPNHELYSKVSKDFRNKYLGKPWAYTNYVEDQDEKSLVRLLNGKKGICRNYSDAVKGVFEVLKKMQSDNGLVNMYCDFTDSMPGRYDLLRKGDRTNKVNFNNSEQLGKTGSHIRNTFYVVQATGIQSISIDATFVDTTPAKVVPKNSYSAKRFLFTNFL